MNDTCLDFCGSVLISLLVWFFGIPDGFFKLLIALSVIDYRLYKKCRDKKLLCSRKGRQYNQPTQKAIEQGLFNTEISGGFKPIAMVTPQGLQYLAEMYTSEEYPILMLLTETEK